ncbi:MAG: hypothetical protein QNI99_15755 [Woeseiaceae bacterium]|nr:hypothetical protein [Woeseiaceae bacterium]
MTAQAEPLEGDYLYGVSTVRAAPGELSALLDWFEAWKATDFHEAAGLPEPLVMRHTQGDQWDLLVIKPMESWLAHFDEDATAGRQAAADEHAELLSGYHELVAFHEDHFAYGPPLSALQPAWDESDFFHVEMFYALPGLAGDLMEQRRMENEYLAATGQVPNFIFRRSSGSDVDVFTIGFHESLQSFAAPAPVTDEEKQNAARDAGFDGLADISFYMRSLISAHRDTLAVKVE